MAISFSGAQSLPVRLGHIFGLLKSCCTFLAGGDLSAGGLRSIGVLIDNIRLDYTSTDLIVPEGVYALRDQTRELLNATKSAAASLASTCLITQVDRDVTLTIESLQLALEEMITQLIGVGTIYAATDDFDASTVSISATAATVPVANTGTGKVVVSVKRPDARDNEYVYAETIELVCDSDVGDGVTARSEGFLWRGEKPANDSLSWDWPLGSGCSGSITSTDSELDASQNLLTNSDFGTFTVTDTPDNFVIAAGAATTNILKETSIVARTGKDSGAGLIAGTIRFALVDSAHTVLTDDAGNSLSLSVLFSTTTASYVAQTAVFVTPKTIDPTGTYKLEIKATTDPTSTESMYIADLAFMEMVPLYGAQTLGPYIAVFSGPVNWIKKDRVNVAVANNYAGDFQQMFWRCFHPETFGSPTGPMQLPSDTGGTETINDSLIVG